MAEYLAFRGYDTVVGDTSVTGHITRYVYGTAGDAGWCRLRKNIHDGSFIPDSPGDEFRTEALLNDEQFREDDFDWVSNGTLVWGNRFRSNTNSIDPEVVTMQFTEGGQEYTFAELAELRRVQNGGDYEVGSPIAKFQDAFLPDSPYQFDAIKGTGTSIVATPRVSLCDGRYFVFISIVGANDNANHIEPILGQRLNTVTWSIGGEDNSSAVLIANKSHDWDTEAYHEFKLEDFQSGLGRQWSWYVNGERIAHFAWLDDTDEAATEIPVKAMSSDVGHILGYQGWFDDAYVKGSTTDDVDFLGAIQVEERLPTDPNLIALAYDTRGISDGGVTHVGTGTFNDSYAMDTTALSFTAEHSALLTWDVMQWNNAVGGAGNRVTFTDDDDAVWYTHGSPVGPGILAHDGNDFPAPGDATVAAWANIKREINWTDTILIGDEDFTVFFYGSVVSFANEVSYPGGDAVDPEVDFCLCSPDDGPPSSTDPTQDPPGTRLRRSNYTGVLNSAMLDIQTRLGNLVDADDPAPAPLNLDCNSQRVRNVADATGPLDGVNFGQLKTHLGI